MRKIRTLCYCILQGIKGIWKNRIHSLASIGTIAACLLLVGIFYSISANFSEIMHSAETMVGMTVFFEDDTSEEQILEVGQLIRLRAEVADVTYISAEEAWNTYKKESLNPELAATFGNDNPLENSASLEVRLNDVSMQKSLVRYIEGLQQVRKVNHSDSVAEGFAGVQNIIRIVSLGLIGILVAVSIFLIRTTISIGINVRREEISIMSIIGATDFFIRAPFVVEGMVIGLIGSLIPVGILSLVYEEVTKTMRAQFESVFSRINFIEREVMINKFMMISVALGLAIGVVASYLTSKHQIRKISTL